jgi:hypothetical protein
MSYEEPRQAQQTAQIAQVNAQAEITTEDHWGDLILAERQAELQDIIDRWQVEADHGDRVGPFDPTGRSDEERSRLRLSGADIFWLVDRSGRD